MPTHFRHGRKRLCVTVEADNEDEAIDIAKKAVLRRYPDGKIDTVKVSKPQDDLPPELAYCAGCFRLLYHRSIQRGIGEKFDLGDPAGKAE